MKLILISHPDSVPDEIKVLGQMLELGIHRLHLRKPTWSQLQLGRLIQQLPGSHYKKLVLHEHHALVDEFGLGGKHYKSTQQVCGGLARSKSFHALEDLLDPKNEPLEYGFISPVFDSISKTGYTSAFEPKTLKKWLEKNHAQLAFELYALGGVGPEKLPEVKAMGFDGAAILGGIWTGQKPIEKLNQYLNQLI